MDLHDLHTFIQGMNKYYIEFPCEPLRVKCFMEI